MIDSDSLTQGFQIWCKCGHSLYCHSLEESDEDSIGNVCKYDNSVYVCSCQKFEPSDHLITLVDYSQQNVIAALKDSSIESDGSIESSSKVNHS